MRLPFDAVPLSPFMGNYFCLIDQPRLAFVAVAKNGVTYLKKHAIYSRTGRILHDEDNIHNAIGYDNTSPYLVPVEKMPHYETTYGPYLKFAVWRDPVERLVSTYKYFLLEREWRIYFNYMGFYDRTLSFDEFLNFVEFELRKPNPLFQDEHIRRQTDCFRMEDIDLLVPMGHLNTFLQRHGVELLGDRSNETSVEFTVPVQYEPRIRTLYRQDYDLVPFLTSFI